MSVRRISLAMLLVLLAVTLCGCSSSKDQENASVQIAIASMYVPYELPETVDAKLREELPELYAEGKISVINGISMGDSESDPETTMAGMTRMMGMLASGEIDLMICDSVTAKRYADSGRGFIPVSELFAEEEITALNLKTVMVPVLDDEGNETGEMSAPCGIDLSACTLLTQTLYKTDVAAYVIVDSSNLDNAKAVITYLATAR